MKKLYIALTSLVFLFTSCDMDVVPQGEIHDEEALISVKDYEAYSNGLYAMMRSVTSGDNVVLSDIQLDDFHAVIGNGNRRMEFYNGSFTPATSEISSYYASFYAVIASTNFMLDYSAKKMTEALTTEDKARMDRYNATARFIRAYCYNSLADKFCASYKNSTDVDAANSGLSLQLTYAPTSDNGKYPGRSTLRATYTQILADLNSALTDMEHAEKVLKETPVSDNFYISSDAIKALLARVNLNMGNDAEALRYATEVIKTNRYQLVSRSAFQTLWAEDTGNEVIWRVQADYTYHGSATGDAFAANDKNSDYLPTTECIELFDENDVRWDTWFEEVGITTTGGSASMFRFMKYPGNKNLYASTASSNYVNIAKPFRSPELYLIAAEASYNLANEDNANAYLFQLMKVRNERLRQQTYSGVKLWNEIQDERHRELMGEGHRLTDLKRWHIGFTRGTVWDSNDKVIISNYKNIHYDADDYRFVWPIPQHEIDANPQVKQNVGY